MAKPRLDRILPFLSHLPPAEGENGAFGGLYGFLCHKKQ